MTLTYTQVTSDTFQASGSGWEDYDIYTIKNIPKGSIVEIVACNDLNDNAVTVGVREDGSTTDRYILLHEGEGGDMVTCTFLTTVDASTGYIEIYSSDNTNGIFYIMGYWEGTSFTELWENISVTSGDENKWIAKTISGGVASRCHIFTCGSDRNTGASICGVRATDDTGTTRSVDVHEAG